jgi:NADH dehydrogenase FAD-containing subunit
VASVSKNVVTVVDAKKSETSEIPFGACVWATGVAMHPLVKQLQVRDRQAGAATCPDTRSQLTAVCTTAMPLGVV